MRVYKDVDVSVEIDGLSNMQDIPGAGSQYKVSVKATNWEIKEGEMICSLGNNAQGIKCEMETTKN